jgi:hypothetical protein
MDSVMIVSARGLGSEPASICHRDRIRCRNRHQNRQRHFDFDGDPDVEPNCFPGLYMDSIEIPRHGPICQGKVRVPLHVNRWDPNARFFFGVAAFQATDSALDGSIDLLYGMGDRYPLVSSLHDITLEW